MPKFGSKSAMKESVCGCFSKTRENATSINYIVDSSLKLINCGHLSMHKVSYHKRFK